MNSTSLKTAASTLGWPASISSVMPVSLVISDGTGTSGSTSVEKVPDDLRAAHDRSGDLDDAVAVRVVAGRLDVDDGDLVVEPEDGGASALGKRPVGRLDVFVRTRDEEVRRGSRESRAKTSTRAHEPPPTRRTGRPHRAPRKDALLSADASCYWIEPPMVRDTTYHWSPTFLKVQV